MENAGVKTIAGFLNTDGGTLLIGVDDSGAVLGLRWLTTHLRWSGCCLPGSTTPPGQCPSIRPTRT